MDAGQDLMILYCIWDYDNPISICLCSSRLYLFYRPSVSGGVYLTKHTTPAASQELNTESSRNPAPHVQPESYLEQLWKSSTGGTAATKITRQFLCLERLLETVQLEKCLLNPQKQRHVSSKAMKTKGKQFVRCRSWSVVYMHVYTHVLSGCTFKNFIYYSFLFCKTCFERPFVFFFSFQ